MSTDAQEAEDGYTVDLGGPLHLKFRTKGWELCRKLGAVHSAVDEYRLHFTEDGLRVSVIDLPKVFQVQLAIKGSYGTDFTPVTVGIEAESLERALTPAEDAVEVTLSLTHGEDEITIVGRNTMDYAPLVDPGTLREDASQPDLDELQTIAVDGMKFKGAVGAVSSAVAGGVRLSAADGELVVEGPAKWREEMDQYQWAIDATTVGEAESVYDQSRLQKIANAVDPNEEVKLMFADEYPLRVIQDGIKFLLAPKLFRE